MAAILVAGMVGVAIPLAVGRKRRRLLSTESGFFALAKAFATGVILAMGFVHMLHDAEAGLTDPCLPHFPWRRFSFSGFVAMAATLVLDFLATQFYERKHHAPPPPPRRRTTRSAPSLRRRRSHPWTRTRTRAPPRAATRCISSGCAHAAAHGHSHHHHGHAHGHAHAHAHAHAHGDGDEGQVSSHVHHVVVSQALDLKSKPPLLAMHIIRSLMAIIK
uniref:Uncharacterized protein n=1 Tax=Ananas comosus var. bracteatus TaxID=296719 RepID=A0A6V7QB53_ANACO|nr:unnamed protein product [Ananas comosus var. bracteatus]